MHHLDYPIKVRLWWLGLVLQYPCKFEFLLLPFDIGGELAQWSSTRLLIQRSPVRFRTGPHTRIMDYDEACFMHLTPGVVHNFPKAVGV